MTTKTPGRSTCAESSVAWGSATRTPARRTSSERLRYRSRKTRSPPMPRSTRRPATVSAPTAVSWPTCSRCSRCRACSGRITVDRLATRTGTPSSTTRPSRVDADSRIAATTKYEAIAPASRAVMSNAPPARSASLETVATTSPVVRRVRTAGAGQRRVVRDDLDHPVARLQPVADGDAVPERAGDRLDDAESEQGAGPGEQCLRCRRCRRPSSIARPRTHGSSACASIQTIPKVIPSRSVPSCWRPTQIRKRVGERVSGRPRIG